MNVILWKNKLIYTKLSRNWDGAYSDFEGFVWYGDRALCCSDPNATEDENFKATAAMTHTLQNDYNQTFAHNQSILGNLTTTLNQAIAKPQGFTSPQMAALRTGAMDTTSREFAGAKVGAGAAAARYGGDVASGVTGQIMGGLAGQEAGVESSQQNQITEANAQLQQENYWKGIQGLSTVASEYNPTAYAGAATSSSGATTGAAHEVAAEKQQGFENAMAITKGIAGLAMGVAGPIAGGFGNLDTTGGSTFGEQIGNFASGMGKG